MGALLIRKYKRVALSLMVLSICYFVFNGFKIYNYSSKYSEDRSDAAIVLGAGTSRGQLSKIFQERINHSIYLYNANVIRVIILTGGYGAGQELADSEIARNYILGQGIPGEAILLEKNQDILLKKQSYLKKNQDILLKI
jgi:uncharacterized SAM-binding protein YcdF (DUF218 family)